jgi:hypothetical protein
MARHAFGHALLVCSLLEVGLQQVSSDIDIGVEVTTLGKLKSCSERRKYINWRERWIQHPCFGVLRSR